MEQVIFMHNNKLASGYIQTIDGELIDVALANTDEYRVGESVVFLHGGKRFELQILKINSPHIYLLAPLFQSNFPSNRRRIPRIQVELSGFINHYLNEKVYEFQPETPIRLVDLSVQGFGFITGEPLKINNPYYLYINEKDLAIKTKTVILNEHLADDGFRYGCEIQSITKEDFHALRRYVLMQQLNSLTEALQ